MQRRESIRFEDTNRRGWWIPLAAVAAVVVALALAAAVFLGQPGEPVSGSVAPLSSRLGLAAKAALLALGSDETEFESARAELLEVLDSRREDLPETTHDTVTENLEIIEAEIEAISNELERDPENPRLARLLAAAYQRELELLQRVAALPSLSSSAEGGS
jgi:hypothetical protein